LERIEAPILVAHGDHDTTASPDDAHDILAAVSSEVREHRAYARSGHVVAVDVDGAELARETAAFLLRFTRDA
jgi:esterase/lipase